MKQNKTVKPNRKKYIKILKRTRKLERIHNLGRPRNLERIHKLRDIKYDFSKIHPASIMLHKK